MIGQIGGGIVTGIIIGSLYALMATGLSIIWNTTGFLNFWHGGLIVIGAYSAWFFLNECGIPIQIGIILSFIVTFGLGVAFERLVVKPIRNKPNPGAKIIVSGLALGFMTPSLILWLAGPVWKSIPALLEGAVNLGFRVVTYNEIIIAVVALGTLTAFDLFFNKTRYGLAMNSLAQNRRQALLCGINTDIVYMLVFGLGCAFAGVSGVLLSQRYFLRPEMGTVPLMKGLAIIIVAGKGSTRGVIPAALGLGILEGVASVYVGKFWATGLFFFAMVAILLVRPKGLFGREEVL